MRKEKHSLSKRLLATILSMVMVFSMMPNLGVSAQSDTTPSYGIIDTETVADAHTLDSWKQAFDPENISTEHAGGIWTDKSVLTSGNISALGNIADLEIGENNFLVALSALAANSIIVGQGSTPTDTVFVLDISGSMEDNELRAMVSATNDAIHSLLSGEDNENRVGIVLYSTNAYTLLPLDHYTPVVDNGTTEYIELQSNWGGYQAIRTGRVTSGSGWNQTTTYIKNSSGEDVQRSVDLDGGTYIQGGLWEAWNLFNDAEEREGARTPVLVLMSDGAPTYTTNRYNNVPDDSNYGAGNRSTDADGFVTQLTAAYVKEQMKAKYNSDAYLYTLGLGVDDVTDSDVAEEVLDPAGNTHSGIEALWTTFNGLSAGQTMRVALGDSNQNNRPSVTYDAAVAGKSAYVDRYFEADEASDLAAAFRGIVNEISLQNGYYVTRLDSEDANLGGYITFVDEISTGMQVKEIEGILIGEQLYSGAILAAALESGAFGTRDEPTDLGDNMVWALKERLGIEDADAARDLLADAYSSGQLYYDSETGAFSNYIGWFGDSSGNFLGFWDAEDPNVEIPEGAAFVNKSYGMLGTTTSEQTNHASDMMYVAVQVSKPITDGEILDKSPETVTFRIPAALLPVVTYQIELDGETVETSTNATVTYKGAEPIRLLYEVGVHEKLTPMNIQEFVREGYQAKDENGNYYLYTNAWHWDGADAPGNDWTDKNNHPTKDNEVGKEVLPDTGKNTITYAYFEPGEDNEHYYFTANEDIYIKDGDSYTKVTDATQLVEGNTYYYQHHVFTTTQNGVENAGVIGILYEELSAEALQVAMGESLTYVPKGTMHFYGHTHDRDKETNTTGSYFAVRHHLVDAKINSSNTDEHSYELVYMGNNGRVTYAPAQGISISKQMADGSTPDAAFTFDIVLTAPEGVTLADEYQTIYVAADGTESGDTVSVTDGKAAVSVKPGETVYILGLPAGTTYTVTERRSEGYLQSDATGETGTVPANDIAEAVFTNRVRGVGSLNVVKTVTYPEGITRTDAADNNKFPVTVTVTEGDVKFNGTVKLRGEDYIVTDGVISFEIVDGETVTITGLPEGYSYTVVEDTTNLPNRYSYVSGTNLTGTITTAASSAALYNKYEPEGVTINDTYPTVSVNIHKVLNDANGNEIETWLEDFQFDFTLFRFVDDEVDGDWVEQDVSIDTIDDKGESVSFSLAGQSFDAVGTYLFRVSEENKGRLGMTYDTTDHDFRVYVTDTNLDGKLEISKVEVIDAATELETDEAGNWVIGATFTNVYEVNSTHWAPSTAKKTLTGREMLDGEFAFILYSVDEDGNRTEISTVSCGKLGDIHFPEQVYTQAGIYTYVVAEKIGDLGGVTYDKSEYQVVVTVEENAVEGSSASQLSVTSVVRTKIKDAEGNTANQSVEQVTFENQYKADPTTLDLEGKKTLTNLTPGVQNPDMTSSIEAKDYTFILTMNDGSQFKQENPGEAAGYSPANEAWIYVNAGGSFSRSGLYFDEAGTYVFKLVEEDVNSSELPGVTKDNSVYLITVVVTDNGEGALEVTSVTYTKDGIPVDSIVFNNTYKAEATDKVILSGDKTLTGIRDIVDGEFSFVLKDEDGNEVETVKNDGNAFTFTGLTFDTVGTYTYTVSEVNGDSSERINGVKYDPTVYNVTITVTDDGSGKLTASVAYDTGVDAIAFTNDYVAAPVKVALTGRKLLAGRPTGLQENEFSFILTGDMVANGSETVSNDAEGTISFTEIEFTEEGTYTFTIREDIPAEKAPGIHYDETVMEVTVTVEDNGKGQLVATVDIPNQDVANVDFRFFNRYHAEDTAPVVLEGTKELTGRPAEYPLQDNEFSFILKDEDGNVVETVKNKGTKFTFTGLVFDAAGVYNYTIEEENGGATINGITYSNVKYNVTITVTDEGTGKLKVDSIAYTKGEEKADKVVFENKYEAKPVTDVVIEAGKTLTDITGGGNVALTPKDDDFSFNLKGENVDETVKNVGGKVTFKLDFNQAGKYEYTLSEVKGDKTGIGYDETVYDVTVTVTDNGEGQLVAKVEYEKTSEAVEPEDVVFANTFKAADAELMLAGKKTLDGGRDLKEGEFSFHLKGEGVDETVTNALDGNFSFKTLKFDTVGEYKFTITEVKGSDTMVKYDETVYEITVTVSYDGEKMTAVAAVDGETVDEYGFTNIFTPAPVSVTITAEKKLTNYTKETMGVDGFTFQLTDGTTPVTKVSGTDGLAKFELTFDAVGTYTYKLTEVKGNVEDMTYDEKVYDITVTVTQDPATGELKAAVSQTENAVFTNVYGTYEQPPKTADASDLTRWTAMLTVSAFSMLAVLVIGKKKLQEQ